MSRFAECTNLDIENEVVVIEKNTIDFSVNRIEKEKPVIEKDGDTNDFSVTHPSGAPLVIRNNTNCVFNIKF